MNLQKDCRGSSELFRNRKQQKEKGRQRSAMAEGHASAMPPSCSLAGTVALPSAKPASACLSQGASLLMSDSLFQDIADYIRVSKDAITLLKSAFSLLPRGEKRDEAESKIKAAEEALKRSDAALAQKLGYQLCRCTYPPQIMLWHEQQKVTVCPNPDCCRTIKDFYGTFAKQTGLITCASQFSASRLAIVRIKN